MKCSGVLKSSCVIHFKGKLASSKAERGGSCIVFLEEERFLFNLKAAFNFPVSWLGSYSTLSAPASAFQPTSFYLLLESLSAVFGCNQVILPSRRSPGPKNLKDDFGLALKQ